MRTQTLGQAISLAAVAAQTAVAMNKSPFLNGRTAALVVGQSGGAGAYTLKVQKSGDGTTWTDVASLTSTELGAGPRILEVKLDRYMRANVTAAGSAGSANVYLIADV